MQREGFLGRIDRNAKLSKTEESRHSGQAERDPESGFLKEFWIPAPAPDPIHGRPE
jgi:hypothetical protein